MHDEWKQIDIEGELKFLVPPTADYHVDESRTTTTINFEDESAILVSRFQFRRDQGKDVHDSLKNNLDYFLSIISRKYGPPRKSMKILELQDLPNGMIGFQGILIPEGQELHYWAARTISMPTETEYYLLHWNGPSSDGLDDALRTFDSFESILFQRRCARRP